MSGALVDAPAEDHENFTYTSLILGGLFLVGFWYLLSRKKSDPVKLPPTKQANAPKPKKQKEVCVVFCWTHAEQRS
jgi:hypothetical protein